MPMDRRVVPIPLTTGLQQKTDPRSVDASGAASMSNCVMEKNGAVRKRFGNRILSGQAWVGSEATNTPPALQSITAAVNGGSYKTASWLTDGQLLYINEREADAWVALDNICDSVALDRLALAGFITSVLDRDQAYANGYLLAVMTSDPLQHGFAQLHYTIYDPLTRACVVPLIPVDQSIAVSVYGPKLVVCGNLAVLTYVQGGSVMGRTLDMTNVQAGWSVASTVAADGFNNIANGVYDTCATDSGNFIIAYEASNGGHFVAIKKFTSAFALVTAQFDETVMTHLTAITCVGTTNEWMWAVYTDNTSATCKAWAWQDSSPSTHVAPFTITGIGGTAPGRIVAARNDGTHITAYVSQVMLGPTDGANMVSAVLRASTLNTSGGFSKIRTTSPAIIASKPYVAPNGRCYLGIQLPSALQGTVFLAWDAGFGQLGTLGNSPADRLVPVATLNPRLAKNISDVVPVISATVANTATHIVPLTSLGAGVLGLMSSEYTTVPIFSLYEYPVDTASTLRYQSAELYELEAIAAGAPQVFDGRLVTELVYFNYPQIASTTFGAAGSMQTSGLYQYIAVFVYHDTRGQVHYSATSPPAAINATGAGNNGSCTVVVPGLLTQRSPVSTSPSEKSSPLVYLYRTQANGGIFYLVAQVQGAINSSTTIVDTLSDASIATQPLVYTTGGNLDDFNPPSGRVCIKHRNRWWIAGCPDPTAIWPSKEITTGEAPGFNEAYNFTATGWVRGLASMDDKLVIFVQRGSSYGIEWVSGEGPSDSGNQNDWTPPQQVPTDVGATDQRSIAAGPWGVVFRSIVGGPTGQGGIFLLSRDLQTKYISGPVEDLIAANPVVTSAVISPTRGRVYFTCVPVDVGFANGVRLVWDYAAGGIWSVDTLTDTVTSNSSAGVRCAWVSYSGGNGALAYHWATTGGQAYVESTGIGAGGFLDNGTFYPLTYATAFLKPTEGGFNRFWRVVVETDVLETAHPPILVTQLTFDGAAASTYNELATWTSAVIGAADRFPQFDLSMVPLNQKAKSIQVTITDGAGPGTVTGQSISIGGIILELGVKNTTYRNIPPNQRV